MCVKKENGGLGFRNLFAFNLAMLGKQAWRLVSVPNALSTRILKAKYFPRGDFMEASLGHNPSFTWRSIFSSKMVIKEGYRWKVGNGSNISVWNEPWLRMESNPKLETPIIEGLENLRVLDLIDSPREEWILDNIQQLLVERDVYAILKTPLMATANEDTRIWRFTNDGEYSVKKAYNMIMQRFTEYDGLCKDGDWELIWKLQIPPRVKMFLWRLCRDCLPTKTNLQTRGVECLSICPLCESQLENAFHCFVTCEVNGRCWEILQLAHVVEELTIHVDSCSEFIFKLLQRLSVHQRQRVAMMLWSMWRRRNDKVWNNEVTPDISVVHQGDEFFQDWCRASLLQFEVGGSNPGGHAYNTGADTWTPPPPGCMKCNVDASFKGSDNMTGVGLYVRDEQGSVVVIRMDHRTSCLPVQEREAWSLVSAIKFICSLGITNVIFESDCKSVVDKVYKSMGNKTELGHLITDIKSLLQCNLSFSIGFAKRQVNGAAHELARVAPLFPRLFTRYHVIPCINHIVMNEMI